MSLTNITSTSITFLETVIAELTAEDSMFETAKLIDKWFEELFINNSHEEDFAVAFINKNFPVNDEYLEEIENGLSFVVMEMFKLSKATVWMKLLDCEAAYEMSISFEHFVIYRSQLLDIKNGGFLSTEELVFTELLINIYSIAIDKYLFFANKLEAGFYGINYSTKQVSIGVGTNQGDEEGVPTKANRALLHIFNQYLAVAKKRNYAQYLDETQEFIHDRSWPFTYHAGL